MGDQSTATFELDFARRHVAEGEARIAALLATAAELEAEGRNPRAYAEAVVLYSDVRDHWRRAVVRLESQAVGQA